LIAGLLRTAFFTAKNANARELTRKRQSRKGKKERKLQTVDTLDFRAGLYSAHGNSSRAQVATGPLPTLSLLLFSRSFACIRVIRG